jgi:hypothetical protein
MDEREEKGRGEEENNMGERSGQRRLMGIKNERKKELSHMGPTCHNI